MEQLVFKKEVVDKIRATPVLYGMLAGALGKSIETMPAVLRRNDITLANATIMKIVAKQLGIAEEDLLTTNIPTAGVG